VLPRINRGGGKEGLPWHVVVYPLTFTTALPGKAAYALPARTTTRGSGELLALRSGISKVRDVELEAGVGKQTEPREAVPDDVVDETLKHLPPVVGALVMFQRYTGARPGEAVTLKVAYIDWSKDIWTVTLKEHKTAHRGKSRILYLGPQCQGMLASWLLKAATPYVFVTDRFRRPYPDIRSTASCL
jgi:integrase